MRIVLATDENLIGPAGVCIKSIALAHPGRTDVSVTVLLGDVSAEAKEKLLHYASQFHIDVQAIDVDAKELHAIAANLPAGHLKFGTLLRLMMGSLLPADWSRVLYLDVDLLVMRDLGGLFNMDLEGCIVGVRREEHFHLQQFAVSPASSFNAGVLLIDLDAWRSRNVQERTLGILNKNAEHLRFWDQCALNIALVGDTKTIPETYNSWVHDDDIASGEPLPHIIHYAGSLKPWPNAALAPWGELYYRMSADTPWPVEYKHREPMRSLRHRIAGRLRILAGGTT